MLESAYIKKLAVQIGFDLCGIASARNFSAEQEFFSQWQEAGMGAGLDYLSRNVEKRFSAEALMSGARSVIVCAVNYKNDTSLGYREFPEAVKVASYARTRDYHKTIKKMLLELGQRLSESYPGLNFRAFTDSAPVLEKAYAVQAGLGFIGRNNLLITPSFGSFVLLGELIIDREVDEYSEPYSGAGCAGCTRCVDQCPGGAITERGLDTRRCISRLTVEPFSDGFDLDSVPDDVTLDGWVFGCDVCQSVCPYNQATPFCTNDAMRPLFDPRELDYDGWMQMSEDEFAAKFAGTPLKRAGLGRIKASLNFRRVVKESGGGQD